MTKAEREQTPRIRFELAQEGITPNQWELQVLARGATVCFDGREYKFKKIPIGSIFLVNSIFGVVTDIFLFKRNYSLWVGLQA
jgi:hypothetical protein